MTTGVFGGTFDPPHNGHLLIAEYVRHALGLDRVLFVPSWVSPHKQEREITEGSHRIAMLQLAVEGCTGLEVSDIEVNRGGVSYTVDTLRALAAEEAGELYLLIGSDNFRDFESWHRPEEILSLARLVVMTRPGSAVPAERPVPAAGVEIAVPPISITSTDIRERIRQERSVRHLLPHSVEKYIRRHSLYL